MTLEWHTIFFVGQRCWMAFRLKRKVWGFAVSHGDPGSEDGPVAQPALESNSTTIEHTGHEGSDILDTQLAIPAGGALIHWLVYASIAKKSAEPSLNVAQKKFGELGTLELEGKARTATFDVGLLFVCEARQERGRQRFFHDIRPVACIIDGRRESADVESRVSLDGLSVVSRVRTPRHASSFASDQMIDKSSQQRQRTSVRHS